MKRRKVVQKIIKEKHDIKSIVLNLLQADFPDKKVLGSDVQKMVEGLHPDLSRIAIASAILTLIEEDKIKLVDNRNIKVCK